MDLEEIEVRNDCAGEVQQQFNRPTELGSWSEELSWSSGLVESQSQASEDRGHEHRS
jgi:hypothetical protein